MNRQDLRIQFYGSEDARVYDSDELHLMEEYANLRLSEQKEKHEQDGKIICRMLFQSSSITANVLQLTVGDWRSKSLALPLMFNTTLDGFYFANCVLSAALLSE